MAPTSLFFSVIVCASLVNFQVRAEQTCTSTNNSVIGVVFDSSQNQTGDWKHTINLSKRGLQRGYSEDKNDVPWRVEVGYQPEQCDAIAKDSLNVKISLSLRQPRNPEYKFYPGLGYYKYHPTLDTWPVAKATCEREGAHLAIINSQQEADALKQLIVNTDWAFVGLIKHEAKGEFITIFGELMIKTGFAKWYSGVNPASAAATYTGVLHRTEGTFSYSEQATKRPSLCEQDL